MTGGSITSRLSASIDQVGALTWSGHSKITNVNTHATIILTDVDINISDIANTTSGTGVRSVEGGQITVQGGSNVLVGHSSNASNVGVHSAGVAPNHRGNLAGTPSLVTLIDSNVTVHGNGSAGAHLEGLGSLLSNHSTFTVTGDDSVGINAEAGSVAEILGGAISTTGNESVGANLDGDAVFNMTSSQISAQGTAARFTDNNATDLAAKFTAKDATIFGDTTSFSADAATAEIILTNVTASGSNLLTVENIGSVILNAENSTLSGDVFADIGSETTINMTVNSSLTGSVENANLRIGQSSTWNLTGDSYLTSLGNNGSIKFAAITGSPDDTASYSTITTDSYTGSGGTIYFNSSLNGDASPSDKLVVIGNTSGSTTVKIANTSGMGAQTDKGIEVITVGGNSSGTFALDGDYVLEGRQAVVAGAYAYSLYQGDLSGTDEKNWYLRSALKNGDTAYQSGAPTYEAYPQALLGLNGLPTLQQRIGNRVWVGNGNRVIAQGADPVGAPIATPEEAGVAIDSNGVWGRIEGAHTKIESRLSTSNTNYNQSIFKLQAGIDGLLTENEAGKLIGGLTVHYAHGKTKTDSVYGDGEISTNGYGFGGTLTWYGENGFYLDGQGQVTWYKSDLNSYLTNSSLVDSNDGFGYALSLEAGKRIDITPEVSMTPQAQLVYSHVDFDSFTDPYGAHVSIDRGESLQGRLGLTLDKENSWQNDQGLLNRTHVYGIANLYYEFLEGTKVDLAGVSLANRNDRVWGGIGVGGSYNWNDDKYSIYGEGLINTSLNNFGDSYTVKGQVGFRVKW